MRNPVRVTVLVENGVVARGFRAEHGLSLWLESGSERVLFDTGQTAETLFHNAALLEIDPTEADAIVLSHGHYDHTGGLGEILRRGARPHLFLHPGALVPRYSRHRDRTVHEIGIPADLDEAFLRAHAASVTWADRPTDVTDWLRVTGPIPRRTAFEDTGGDFFLDPDCATRDPIEDDQAAFFDTSAGMVVLLGCGHAGVVNTVHHVRDLTAERPVLAVMGGMHLVAASRERLDRTVDAIRESDVGLLVPAHCTGARAQVRLGSEFPDRWEPCAVGARFEFPIEAGPGRASPPPLRP